jgi:hypothetical protein
MSQTPNRPPPSAAERLSQDANLVDCLFLVMNGIPFDVAFSLDDDERLAWVVVIGTLKGRTYNWFTREWEPIR